MIWVDADACPKVIKDVLFRAAIRTQTPLTLVANSLLTHPNSKLIQSVRVEKGFDGADNYIVAHLQANDLVITADIPLADAVINKNGTALNPRGELYSKENIKQKLAFRNLNDQLRSSGIITSGPSTLNKRDLQLFANALDKFLTHCLPKQ